jgi:Zn finger protein HypA/HybF involved in hydrogenase expression
MKKTTTIKFTCSGCQAIFEFDSVGEHEFVQCPVCGNDHITAKKGNKLTLENFDLTQMCEAPIMG